MFIENLKSSAKITNWIRKTKKLVAFWFCISFWLLMPVAQADTIANKTEWKDEVSRDHWSVAAVESLAKMGILESFPEISKVQSWTRYGFAVTTARIVNKWGFSPQPSTEHSFDAATARDILAALLFEYRDEFTMLQITDPLTSGAREVQAYQRYKAEHPMNASQWYLSAQDRPWIHEMPEPETRHPPLLKLDERKVEVK